MGAAVASPAMAILQVPDVEPQNIETVESSSDVTVDRLSMNSFSLR
jgi:hypothetical protein